MNKNCYHHAIVVLIAATLAFSCAMSGNEEDFIDPDDGGGFTLVDSLFVAGGSGLTTFETNNSLYWSPSGYTLWTIPSGQAEMTTFTERTVQLAKASGNAYSGFGLIICQGDRAGYGITMLTVMINTSGYYTVGKVIGGNYSPIINWTACANLFKGYGIANTLKVTQDGNSGLYTLSINGTVETTFQSNEPVQTAGKSGYLVVISPADKFPAESVKVIFSE